MTEIKLTLTNPHSYIVALNRAALMMDGPNENTLCLDALRGMILDHLPAVTEPRDFGSVVKVRYWNGRGERRWCRTYSVLVDEPWCTGNHMASWAEVVEEASDVEVLRVGIGEQVPTDADEFMVSAGFEPRPEQSVAWFREYLANAHPGAYSKGVEDFAAKVRREVTALRATVITAPEKRVCDNVLALVAALLGES
jgi:hypothetical protein